MSMPKFGLVEDDEQDLDARPRFLVLGVGGGGGNAVNHMVEQGVRGITFVCVNTDSQALDALTVQRKVQLGPGLGAGGNPEKGRELAEEDLEELRSLLTGFDMIFITAGMGGGTGTGAAPVVARVAKDMGILTVAVVTTPFNYEGQKRMKAAKEGVAQLSDHVDAIITIPNEKLSKVYGKLNLKDAFRKADDVLLHAVTGLAQIVKQEAGVIINIDFNDLVTAMGTRGHAMMGIGRASGEDRARAATLKAINSPLLDDLKLENAKGLLINIRAADMVLSEPEEISEVVNAITDLDEGNIFYGFVEDENMGDEIHVTVIATGLTMDDKPRVARPAPMSSAFAIDPAAHATAISQQRAQEAQPQPVPPQPQPTTASVQPRQGGTTVSDYLHQNMPKK